MAASKPDRRVKVLIALEGVIGGALRHLDLLLRHTDPEQFDLHLAVSARRSAHVREDFRRWREAGWAVHEIEMRREASPPADLRALAALVALCRRERFQVVHTHCAKAGFLGRPAGRIWGARTVHTPHVFPFSHDFPRARRALYLRLERLAARWTDRFIMLTEYQRNLLLQHRLAPAERAVVVPNGIEPDEFGREDQASARAALGLAGGAAVALFAGRFTEQKGSDVLLEAARLLQARGAGPVVVAVGEGPQERRLREQIELHRLGDRVLLRGWSDKMPLYYAACDLVVMPSRAEGLPYVVLEAKAAARPVLASLVCGMEELIEHGRDGWLVPPQNPEALARLLAELCADRAELAAAGRRAREGLRPEWHADAWAARIHGIYRELASG